eukprot:g1181.t1
MTPLSRLSSKRSRRRRIFGIRRDGSIFRTITRIRDRIGSHYLFSKEYWRRRLIHVTSKTWPYYYGYRFVNPRLAPYLGSFGKLEITDYALKILVELFDIVDLDCSGDIDVDEFFGFFSFSYVTPLLARYFECFDDDGNLTLDLREFIVAIWQFGTNTDDGMIRFAFDVYDTKRTRYIGWDEISTMLIEAYAGERHMTKSVNRALEQIKDRYEEATLDAFLDGIENAKLGMNKTQFGHFVRANMATFFPLFTLQREIKKKIVGESYWKRINEDLDFTQGPDRKMKFARLKEILQMNGTESDSSVDEGQMEMERLDRSVRRLKMQLDEERSEREERRQRRRERRAHEANPMNWQQRYDRSTGQLFYHNVVTKKSKWEKPKALVFKTCLRPLVANSILKDDEDVVGVLVAGANGEVSSSILEYSPSLSSASSPSNRTPPTVPQSPPHLRFAVRKKRLKIKIQTSPSSAARRG